jgi:hypothetical protein
MAGKQPLSPNQHSLCETRQIGDASLEGTLAIQSAALGQIA